MRALSELLLKNKAWAKRVSENDPEFFETLSQQQSPRYLWIGCSDSRVPANQIVDLMPGEMFVHRNVANVVSQTDLNCLSVVQFAVEVLKVEHVIVCGHYGCGGVKAALNDERLGLIDNWLRRIQRVRDANQAQIDALTSDIAKHDRLCEMNVVEQCVNVARTTVIRDAWIRGQSLTIHSWIYNLADGILRDLDFCASSEQEVVDNYPRAMKNSVR